MIYGYCRVSTWRQASEGESLEVQRRQIEGYALMHALRRSTRSWSRKASSGSIPVEERPAGRALFARLRKRRRHHRAKLDRLFRSALDALQVVEDHGKRGVGLHLLDLGGDISRQRDVEAVPDDRRRLRRGRARPDPRTRRQVKADQKARGRYLGGTCRSASPRRRRRARAGRRRAGGDSGNGGAAGAGEGAQGDRGRHAGEGRPDQS